MDSRVLNFVKADRHFQDGFLEELRMKTASAFQHLHANTLQAGTRGRAVAALLEGGVPTHVLAPRSNVQ